MAAQIHHRKPDYLRPGFDVLMEPVEHYGLDGLRVTLHPFGDEADYLCAVFTYDLASDTYDALVQRGHGTEAEEMSNVYCDDLGEILFGDEAKPWTAPYFQITDGDGNIIAEG